MRLTMFLLTYPLLAEKAPVKIVNIKNSFNAKFTINRLCNLLMMSILLTVIGT